MKNAKFKPPILFHILSLYAEEHAIAKLKICLFILMTDSPNLMLTKVSCYTVCTLTIRGCLVLIIDLAHLMIHFFIFLLADMHMY